MSLRLRRGGGTVAPPTQAYGPSFGAQSVIDASGPRGSIGIPGGSKTTLVSANSVAANQALINGDATGVLWWPKGTYTITTTGYTMPADKINWLETGPLRDATDTALITSTSTTVNMVTVSGANVGWHGGIIHGGMNSLRHSSGGIADNMLVEDAEMRNAWEANFHISGAFPDVGTPGHTLNTTVRYCLFHHAGRYNAHTLGAEGWVWEHNEMHHGNERHIPTTRASSFPDDEGDCKFLGVSGFVWRYNYMHDSDGDLWLDTNMTDGIVEESVFINNHRMAIFNEDNDGVTIRRNYFEDNGTDGVFGLSPNYWQSGAYMGHITIARSADTEVTLNDFLTTGAVTSGVPHHDVRLHYQNLGGTDTIDTNVHHNRFQRTKASATNSGFVTHYLTADARVAHQVSNNVYDFNEYHVSVGQSGSNWFQRAGDGDRTFAQWQAGASLPFAPGSFYDPHGTLTADL